MASQKQWMVSEEELDDVQYQIRNLEDGNYLIRGCAGSGKTVLALQKAKEIKDLDKGSYLVVVYTKVLRTFIEDGINFLGLDPSRVYHYDDLGNFNESTVDYVIVDEVQDMPEERIRYLVGLATKNFMFFGDDAQQLYPNQTRNINLNKIQNIASIEDEKTYELMINHRLPKKIAEFAEKITSGAKGIANQCEREGGDISIQKFNSLKHELDRIVDIISNEGWGDVGIIVSTNKEVEDIKSYLERKIDVEYKYDIKTEPQKQTVNTLDFTTSKVKVMTYHSCKGIQFDHVFLPQCSIDTLDYNYKGALYVAVTRAVETLFISYTTALSPFIPEVKNT